MVFTDRCWPTMLDLLYLVSNSEPWDVSYGFPLDEVLANQLQVSFVILSNASTQYVNGSPIFCMTSVDFFRVVDGCLFPRKFSNNGLWNFLAVYLHFETSRFWLSIFYQIFIVNCFFYQFTFSLMYDINLFFWSENFVSFQI